MRTCLARDGHDTTDFASVTELGNTPVSGEQIERLCNRYFWAASLCSNQDVVEAGCGIGAGLGHLATVSRSLEAGDVSPSILAQARKHYGDRIVLREFDAQALPFADESKDIIIFFEAIYYLPRPLMFFAECRRVLRSRGKILLASANKDLWEFHPSAQSFTYLGVREFDVALRQLGFATEFFGFQRADNMPFRQKALRPLKRLAVSAGIMPKTMSGKRWLKRIVFGEQVPMPAEITLRTGPYVPPTPLDASVPDRVHKVIYCAATLP